MARKFPDQQLAGHPSDYAKAYKQVPGHPTERGKFVLTQWRPCTESDIFWIALSLLFGGRLAPLDFARYPAWVIETVAALFAFAMQHCVDDVLHIGPMQLAEQAYIIWMQFTKACGWDIPVSKSPWPSQQFDIIGIALDLSPVPRAPAIMAITERRIRSLLASLLSLWHDRRLPASSAGKLYGQLMFSTSQQYGRVGRSKLAALKRRQYERRDDWNIQIHTTVSWWIKFLGQYVPRQILLAVPSSPPVVTYSDGEGSGGIGVCIFVRGQRPRAAYCRAHREVRRLWSLQRDLRSPLDQQHDIYNIEAVGPLLILHKWADDLQGQLWLHFIDNESAQQALVKGSSSVWQGDVISGFTWNRVAELRALPWFDRVQSESNPIDGVSRGRSEGPWRAVEHLHFPSDFICELAEHRLRVRALIASEGAMRDF